MRSTKKGLPDMCVPGNFFVPVSPNGCASNVPLYDRLLIMRTMRRDESLKYAPTGAGRAPTIEPENNAGIHFAVSTPD